MTLKNLSELVTKYIKSQWFNFRRQVNEPMAREEPLGFAKLYFYEPNTRNPAITYLDACQKIPNANPVMLDSRGEVPQVISNMQLEVKIEKLDGTTIMIANNLFE